METGVDCGGGVCSACPVGEGCSSDTDCLSLQCIAGKVRGRELPVHKHVYTHYSSIHMPHTMRAVVCGVRHQRRFGAALDARRS